MNSLNRDFLTLTVRSSTRKKVAIIGSGVAGLAAAKYLLAEKVPGRNENYFEVTIFERHSEVGGIWNITSSDFDDYLTPMYQGLETNVPRTMMTFKDFPYPNDVSLFPTHDKIKNYLEAYSKSVRHCIEYSSEVVNVAKVIEDDEAKWKVDVASVPKGSAPTERYFHAVIVAAGTFNKPNSPTELDLDEWKKVNPGSVVHSRDFKNPEDFQNKKVLIIGGGPSYFEIAKLIDRYVKGKIIVSTRNPVPVLSRENQIQFSEVTKLDPKTQSARFRSGATQPGIDKIILCTGYQYDYPYLPKFRVENDGAYLFDLWNQMIWVNDPTLAFVGVPKMSSIFTIVEAQSAFIARVFARRLSIPSKPQMIQELFEELRERLSTSPSSRLRGLGFHNFNYPRDKDYVNNLTEQCRIADERGSGKMPPDFDAYIDWTRENLAKMRSAFGEKGAERHNFRTLESLGFFYRP